MTKQITNIVFFSFFTISISVSAQIKKEDNKKIKVLKIAYITEHLDLTESEAEKFWPVYNIYDKKLIELRYIKKNNLTNKINKLGGIAVINDTDAKSITEEIIKLDALVYKTTTDFFEKLRKILPYRKILKLQVAESNFKRKLLGKLRKERKFKQ